MLGRGTEFWVLSRRKSLGFAFFPNLNRSTDNWKKNFENFWVNWFTSKEPGPQNLPNMRFLCKILHWILIRFSLWRTVRLNFSLRLVKLSGMVNSMGERNSIISKNNLLNSRKVQVFTTFQILNRSIDYHEETGFFAVCHSREKCWHEYPLQFKKNKAVRSLRRWHNVSNSNAHSMKSFLN